MQHITAAYAARMQYIGLYRSGLLFAHLQQQRSNVIGTNARGHASMHRTGILAPSSTMHPLRPISRVFPSCMTSTARRGSYKTALNKDRAANLRHAPCVHARSMSTTSSTATQYEVVIGLEVHAQIAAVSKLFSGSSTLVASSPNAQCSVIDAALPGALPVINEHCVQQAIKTGLALKGMIAAISLLVTLL